MPSSPVYSHTHVCLLQVFSSFFYISLRRVKTNPKDSSPSHSVSAGVLFAWSSVSRASSQQVSVSHIWEEQDHLHTLCKLLLQTNMSTLKKGIHSPIASLLFSFGFSPKEVPQNKVQHKEIHSQKLKGELSCFYQHIRVLWVNVVSFNMKILCHPQQETTQVMPMEGLRMAGTPNHTHTKWNESQLKHCVL